MTAKFDFDASQFNAGIKQMGSKLDGIQGKMGGMGKAIASGVGKALTGLIGKVGGLVAGFGAAKSMLNSMPEIGEAFGIAKNIFMKNFLWPMRQEVMPLLQKMLDWVRVHRTTFVKWGTVVTNVFRTVAVVVKSLWGGLMSIVKVLTDSFQRAFKTNFKTLDEFLNVLSFKISSIAIFLGMAIKEVAKHLEPLVAGVADLVKGTLEFVKAFGEGFMKGFNVETIDRMVKALGNMEKALGKLMESKGMKDFAKVMGFAFAKDLELAVTLLTTAADTISGIITGDWKPLLEDLKHLGEWFTQPFINAKNIVKAMWAGAGGTLKVDKELVEAVNKNPKSRQAWLDLVGFEKAMGLDASKNIQAAKRYGIDVDDAIITKEGKVIRTSPQDNIFATKMPLGGGVAGGSIMIPVNVYVTEGDARQAGANFAEGVASRQRELRSGLLQTKRARGY